MPLSNPIIVGGKEHSHETDQAGQDGLVSHILDDRYPSGGSSRDMAILEFDPQPDCSLSGRHACCRKLNI